MVVLKVYSILGQEVATLEDGVKAAGMHRVVWNAGRMASGMYIIRMNAGQFTSTRKIILAK